MGLVVGGVLQGRLELALVHVGVVVVGYILGVLPAGGRSAVLVAARVDGVVLGPLLVVVPARVTVVGIVLYIVQMLIGGVLSGLAAYRATTLLTTRVTVYVVLRFPELEEWNFK